MGQRCRVAVVVAALGLLAVGCRADPTVERTRDGLVAAIGQQLDEAPLLPPMPLPVEDDRPESPEPTPQPEPGLAEPAAPEPSAAVEAPTVEAAQAEVDEPWDADIKAARLAEYHEFRGALDERLGNDPFELETDPELLPTPDFATRHQRGDTATVVATLDRGDRPDFPLVVTAYANATTNYTHLVMERDAYVTFWRELTQRPIRDDSTSAPAVVETVAVDRIAWSRGLQPEIGGIPAWVDTDPSRWYAGSAIEHLLFAQDLAFLPVEELWRLFGDGALPTASLDDEGRRIHEGRIEPDRVRMAGSLGRIGRDNETATMTTSADANGLLAELEVRFGDDPVTARLTIVVAERGEPLSVPDVRDVIRAPTRNSADHRAATYSWTATGTFQEDGSSPVAGPWTAEGRIHDGRYPESSLMMTAGDVAILGQLGAISVDPGLEVIRRGFESVPYTVGMFPELAPWAIADDVDPEASYIHDPFQVPADLFPFGLGEEQHWVELRTLPELIERDGWNHARVTSGSVDPAYWNFKHREGVGLFAWILSEDPAEEFTVTIGATENGRVERVELRTVDPDGGGAVFDVRVDAEPKEYRDQTGQRASSLTTDPSYAPPDGDTTEEPSATFEDFATASREQYPAFDHRRSPEHLTLIVEQVKDEPSGAYTPDGEYYRWPSVYFRNLIVARLDDDRRVVCLELEDNEWRYWENDFERFWRGYADGSSLDGQILRFNTNGWMSVDTYASDGDRLPGDPCPPSPGH